MNTNHPKSILLLTLFVFGTTTLLNKVQERNLPVLGKDKLTPYPPTQDIRELEALFERNDDGSIGSIEQVYQRLLDGSDIDKLNELKLHENNSVAVQSAWEIARMSKTASPESRFNCESFIGLLEGRFQINVPDWWAEYTLAIETEEWWRMTFPTLQLTHAGEVRCALETSLVESTNGVELRNRDKMVILPRHFFEWDKNEPLSGRVAVAFSSDKCFIAIYGDWGSAHPVVCFDTRTGDVVWETTCAGAMPNINASGLSTSYVELKLDSRGRLVVFGAASVGSYVQVFDQTDGKTVGQFSTRYQRKP